RAEGSVVPRRPPGDVLRRRGGYRTASPTWRSWRGRAGGRASLGGEGVGGVVADPGVDGGPPLVQPVDLGLVADGDLVGRHPPPAGLEDLLHGKGPPDVDPGDTVLEAR